MIYLLFKSYFVEVLVIGLGSIALLLTGLYFIFRETVRNEFRSEPRIEPVTAKTYAMKQTQDEYTAIAGEDLAATKLDLARAYLEAGRVALAKSLLKQVMDNGNDSQQQEAKNLLTSAQS